MQPHDIESLARRLREARELNSPCAPLTDDFPDMSEDDAYAVAQENLRVYATARRLGLVGEAAIEAARGTHEWRDAWSVRSVPLVGSKIGITSESVMRWLNVDHPDYGALTGDMAVPDGGQVDFTRLLQPRAEGEVAFVLKRDLAGPDATAAGVLAATDFLLPALEIIDSRVRDWKLKLADTIADNASCGMFALGSRPVSPACVDLTLCGMTLRHNGEVASTGCGAACMGSPLNAVAWLANRVGVLKAGEIILSGALGPVVTVKPDDYVEVAISGLGRVSVHF
ncbi:MAG: 2-oxopent-4-enoate hydratase [Armatimonadetes bacterium]|nr:2-oxopent-4-enoate hydratase [Armatimonadota bacterium]